MYYYRITDANVILNLSFVFDRELAERFHDLDSSLLRCGKLNKHDKL